MSDGQQGTGYGEPGDNRAPTEWIGSDDPPTGGPSGQGTDGAGGADGGWPSPSPRPSRPWR